MSEHPADVLVAGPFVGKYASGLTDEQKEAIKKLVDAHGSRKAQAVVLPTGVGKTAIGLLYAKWALEQGGSVAFLCQNKALVDQVLTEAALLKVLAVPIHGRIHYASDAAAEDAVQPYRNLEAVGVFTYASYLRGKFTTSAKTIVVDDAHQLYGSIANAKSLDLPADGPTAELYQRTAKLLLSAAEPLGEDVQAFQDPTTPREKRYAIIPFPLIEKNRKNLSDLFFAFCGQFGPSDEKPDFCFDWARHGKIFHRGICVVTESEIVFRPLATPLDLVRRRSGEEVFPKSSNLVLMTATLGRSELFAEQVGLSREVNRVTPVGQFPVETHTGYRLIIPLRDVGGTERRINQALGNAIFQIAERHGKVLAFVQSFFRAEELKKEIGDRAVVFTYKSPLDLQQFLAFSGEPALLCLVNREGGIDIPDQRCRAAVHIDLPLAVDAFDFIRDQVLEDHGFHYMLLGQRLTQALGRLNRDADNRSVHYILDERFRQSFLGENKFIAQFDENLLAECELGRKVVSESKDFAGVLDAARAFIESRGRFDAAASKALAARRMKAAIADLGTAARPVVLILEAWQEAMEGNLELAAKRFEKVAEAFVGEQQREQKAFYTYMAAQFVFLSNPTGLNEVALAAKLLEDAATTSRPGILFFSGASRLASFIRRGETSKASDEEIRLATLRRVYRHCRDVFNQASQATQLGADVGPQLRQVVADRLTVKLQAKSHEELCQGLAEIGRLLGCEMAQTEVAGVDVLLGQKYKQHLVSVAIEAKADAQDSGEPKGEIESDAPDQAARKAAKLGAMNPPSRFHPARPVVISNRPRSSEKLEHESTTFQVPYLKRAGLLEIGKHVAEYSFLAALLVQKDQFGAGSLLLGPEDVLMPLIAEPSSEMDVGPARDRLLTAIQKIKARLGHA